MFRLTFSINLNHYNIIEEYKLTNLFFPLFVSYKFKLRREIRRLKLDGVNTQIIKFLNSQNVAINCPTKVFTYKTLNYIIDNLELYRDRFGAYYIGLKHKTKNPYCNMNIDKICRLLEFGYGEIKPLHIFKNTFNAFDKSAQKLFKLRFRRYYHR